VIFFVVWNDGGRKRRKRRKKKEEKNQRLGLTKFIEQTEKNQQTARQIK